MAFDRYTSWKEVNVPNEKRRLVYFYLMRHDGKFELAAVGKEKNLGHMSYRLVLGNQSTLLRSRREVVNWLNFAVSGFNHAFELKGSSNSCDASVVDMSKFKESRREKLCHTLAQFSWSGGYWICKNKLKHYQSYNRNDSKVSVNDFVYVLSEDGKRLVAYVEDMYEDLEKSKLVLVRWLQTLDEVGFDLPHRFNDREVILSNDFQDLSIECIDGAATVLSLDHFKKFLNDRLQTKQNAFICNKALKDGDLKHFDISRMKGYWTQDIMRYLSFVSPTPEQKVFHPCSDPVLFQEKTNDLTLYVPVPRMNRLKEDVDGLCYNGDTEKAKLEKKRKLMNPSPSCLETGLRVGAKVEVFSQDSGIRGCWFIGTIVKIQGNKVKVRYLDVKDATDGSKELEEWIIPSKTATPDHLRIRLPGRSILRPLQDVKKQCALRKFDVGMVVDAWLNDAWWEGLIIEKSLNDKFHIYFSGEQFEANFDVLALRHSHEWVDNNWTCFKERPDIARNIQSSAKSKNMVELNLCEEPIPQHDGETITDSATNKKEVLSNVLDLCLDSTLSRLRWSTSKKRKQSSTSVKRQYISHGNHSKCDSERSLVPHAVQFNIDHDTCKLFGASQFSTSANLVTV